MIFLPTDIVTKICKYVLNKSACLYDSKSYIENFNQVYLLRIHKLRNLRCLREW